MTGSNKPWPGDDYVQLECGAWARRHPSLIAFNEALNWLWTARTANPEHRKHLRALRDYGEILGQLHNEIDRLKANIAELQGWKEL